MERTFDVELWQDESGTWVVECPDLPGCISQGETQEEALEMIEDAIRACLIVRREQGFPDPAIKRQVTLVA